MDKANRKEWSFEKRFGIINYRKRANSGLDRSESRIRSTIESLAVHFGEGYTREQKGR